MDSSSQQVLRSNALPEHKLQELKQIGFLVIPGPLSAEKLRCIAASYDMAMSATSGSHHKIASTTTRLSDLLSHDCAFEDVFLYKPLLAAARFIIGEPVKLSSLLGRTLHAQTEAQDLHADLPRDSSDAPLVGFILMIDPFRQQNGATRFVPGSHSWRELPSDKISDTRQTYCGEVLACGDAGSMILFNGAIWHGHTANSTPYPRRSIQGYFVRRTAHSGFDFVTNLAAATRKRLSRDSRYLLSIDD